MIQRIENWWSMIISTSDKNMRVDQLQFKELIVCCNINCVIYVKRWDGRVGLESAREFNHTWGETREIALPKVHYFHHQQRNLRTFQLLRNAKWVPASPSKINKLYLFLHIYFFQLYWSFTWQKNYCTTIEQQLFSFMRSPHWSILLAFSVQSYRTVFWENFAQFYTYRWCMRSAVRS